MFGGPELIVPGVYLGGFLSLEACKRLDIECVLSVVDTNSYEQIKTEVIGSLLKEKPSMDLHQIDVEDRPAANLLEHLDDAVAYIEKAVQANKSVLVHCMAGVSRSATCVAAYIVKNLGLPPTDAIAKVKEGRSCANPNFGFVKQLNAWHKMGNTIDKESPLYLGLFPKDPKAKSEFDIPIEVPIVQIPDHNMRTEALVASQDTAPTRQTSPEPPASSASKGHRHQGAQQMLSPPQQRQQHQQRRQHQQQLSAATTREQEKTSSGLFSCLGTCFK